MPPDSAPPPPSRKAAAAPALASAPPTASGGSGASGASGASGGSGASVSPSASSGAGSSNPPTPTQPPTPRKPHRPRRRTGRPDTPACAPAPAPPPAPPPHADPSAPPSDEDASATPLRLALDLFRGGESELRIRTILEGQSLPGAVVDEAIEQAYLLMRTSWTARGAREKMALALEQRARIVAEAMASSDWRVALSAMEQREKLLGLTGPDAMEQAATNLLDLLRLATESGNLTDAPP